MRARFSARLVFAVVVCAKSVACSHPQPSTPTTSLSSVVSPQWVQEGSGLYTDTEGHLFLRGVGVRGGIKNERLQAYASANHARAETTKLVEILTASLQREGGSSLRASDPLLAEEKALQEVTQAYTADLKTKIKIIDQWIHPTTGATHTAARFDVDGLFTHLLEAPTLKASTKKRLEGVFRDLLLKSQNL